MGIDSKLLPPNILKCVDKADRKKLGKGGQTAEETLARGEAKTEKILQQQIANLLSLKGIVPFSQRMDKKTRGPIGQPDFLFAVIGYESTTGYWTPRIYACAVEVKLPGKHLDEAQRLMRKKMTTSPNHWHCKTVRSVDEMLAFLKELGVE